MIIGIEFDGVIVSTERVFDDFSSPLQLVRGARSALQALKKANHILVLCSVRASHSRRIDPMLDPLVRAGVRRVDARTWETEKAIHEARYQQMLAFVNNALPNIFDVIDDGFGRPELDIYVGPDVVRFGHGVTATDWSSIQRLYGDDEG